MKKKYKGRGRGRGMKRSKLPVAGAKALMGLRPERWSSTTTSTLQIPAHNLPLLLARVVSLSVRHYPLLGRKESVAACRHPCHHLRPPFQSETHRPTCISVSSS